MNKLYFGHPVNVYGTELESKLIEIIRRHFQDWELENPNQVRHQAAYKDYKKNTGRGMDYYFNEVLPGCDGGIFLPFRDLKLGAGVFGEAEFLHLHRKPVWEITHSGVISLVMYWSTVEKRVLSVDETRARVYGANGEILAY